VLWCINEWLYPALLEAKQATISPYIIEWGGVKVLSVEKKGVGASAKRAGVKCSPHVLRHTAAVWMAVEGVPMEEIAQYLGRGRQDDVSHLRALLAGLHAACGKGSGSATLAL
jgi:integrase